ncbi:MAG: hypothetical protein HN842_09655 [Gammaproteobacteria bacterium]|jgi:hypothetical protein|nr:hypothetical protein [Gammaproteobacteria bacterium]
MNVRSKKAIRQSDYRRRQGLRGMKQINLWISQESKQILAQAAKSTRTTQATVIDRMLQRGERT